MTGSISSSPNCERFSPGASRDPALIWSVADWFDSREPDLPPLADPFTGKPMQRDMHLE